MTETKRISYKNLNINFGITSEKVRKTFGKEFGKENLIKREGGRKEGYWKIKEH